MKRRILVISIIPLIFLCSCKQAVKFEQLEDREGALYFNDVTYTGACQDFYDEGILKSEMNYKDGLLNGNFVSFYINGNKQSEGNYILGKRTGLWKRYHDNGNIYLEGEFLEGKKM